MWGDLRVWKADFKRKTAALKWQTEHCQCLGIGAGSVARSSIVYEEGVVQLRDDQIAHVVHEANRAFQRVTGDSVVSRSWWEAPKTQRDGLLNGVRKALAGATPEELHEEWVQYRAERGWKYGRVKDEHGKTHPCMVPYAELPPEQQMKDQLLWVIVRTLAAGLEAEQQVAGPVAEERIDAA